MPLRLLTQESQVTDSREARGWVEAHLAQAHSGKCVPFWLDITEPDDEAIDWLARVFPFHPLTIEDLRSPNERGKIELYDGYLFLIAHAVFIEGLNSDGRGRDLLQSWAHTEDRRLATLREPARATATAGGNGRAVAAPPRPPPSANQDKPSHATIIKGDARAVPGGQVCECDSHELHAYLSQCYLVTVHDPGMKPVDKVWNYLDRPGAKGDPHPLEHGPDYLLYRVLDNLTDSFFTALEVTADQIDYLEDIVIDRPDRDVLESIFTVKRNLLTIRRLSVPMRESSNVLSNSGTSFIKPDNQVYMRDVHNLLVAVAESADTQRDSSSGVLDAYLSSVNNNLSVVMKRLTVIATIFMPLSFIVGFGGMNFTSFIPYNSPILFWSLMASLLITPITMFIWFQRNRWT